MDKLVEDKKPVTQADAEAAVRVLIEWAGDRLFVEACVRIFAEPRCRLAVLLENLACRPALSADHGIVAGESGSSFAHDTEAVGVMVASGAQ